MIKKGNKNVEILTVFTKSKTGDETQNEDMIYIDDNFIAVFDGATSKTSALWNEMTSGKLAVSLIKECLENKMHADMDCETAIDTIQKYLEAYNKEHCLHDQNVFMCASGIIYSIQRKEIWHVGDGHMMIDEKLYAPNKKIDIIVSEARAMMIHEFLAEGYTEKELLENDLARNVTRQISAKQRYFENADSTYGFGVFNGIGRVSDYSIFYAQVGNVIVLSSDGYPKLCDTLEDSERELNKILGEDPLCYKIYKSTKGLSQKQCSFDDRTYVKFKVL